MKKDYDEEYEVLATHPLQERQDDTCVLLTDIHNEYIFEDRWQLLEDDTRDYFDSPGYGDLAPVFRTCLPMHRIKKVEMTYAEYVDMVATEVSKSRSLET